MVRYRLCRRRYLWLDRRLMASWRCWTHREVSPSHADRQPEMTCQINEITLATGRVAAVEFSWGKTEFLCLFELSLVKCGWFLIESNEVQLCFKCSPSAFVATETLCSAHSKTGSTDVTSACKSGHLSDGECKRRCLYHNLQSRFALWRSHCCAVELPFNIHHGVA